jgi:hypothetical protein
LAGLDEEHAAEARRVAGQVAGAFEGARPPPWAERLPSWLRPRRTVDSVPARIPWRLWTFGIVLFLGVYCFNFGYVHIVADTRLCRLRLDDPFFKFFTHDERWALVTVTIYSWVNIFAMALMLVQAIFHDQRPFVRYGIALPLMCFQRDLAILLVPLCRTSRMPGTSVLTTVPHLNLGFAKIPWHMFASNDLLVSGHVAEFLLMLWATKSWPRVLRYGLVASLALQILGLMHTQGHYTIDMLLAIPIAYFADAMAVKIMRAMTPATAR